MKSYLTVSPDAATNKEECDTRSSLVGRRTESLRRTLPRVTVCYYCTTCGCWLLMPPPSSVRNVLCLTRHRHQQRRMWHTKFVCRQKNGKSTTDFTKSHGLLSSDSLASCYYSNEKCCRCF